MGKKIKVAIGALIFIIILGGTAFWFFLQNKIELIPKEQVIVEYGDVVEYSSKTFLELEGVSEKKAEKIIDEAKVNIDKDVDEQDVLAVGEYVIEIAYKDQVVKSVLKVQDTVAPVFDECGSVEVELGTETLDLSAYVHATDLQGVTYAYDTSGVKLNEVGNYECIVVATDSSMNKSEKSIEVIVKDTTPPVFGVIKKIEIENGNNKFDFSKVVKAEDLQEITYKYHTNNIDFKKAGTYKLKVEAIDASGNSSVCECDVKIKDVPKTQSTASSNVNKENLESTKVVYKTTGNRELDSLCDEILNKIINSGMSDRQKLKAVYNWVESNIRYSGSTAIGDWRTGAIKTLSTRKGNCVAYCYASEALLTRLGFPNIEICQTDKGHFWNMVKYNGSWYHFDTTRGWGTQRFLWTTTQIKEYRYEAKDLEYGEFDENAYPKTP